MMSDCTCIAHFENYLLTEKRLSENSLDAYKIDLAQLLRYIHEQEETLATLSNETLKSFLAMLHKRHLSTKSIARKISTIKQLYLFLEERFGIENKASVLIYPKIEQKLPTYLTAKEIQKLLQTAASDTTPRGLRNNVMIQLLYASGMRVSELCNITSDQIHFDTGFIQLMGKGNKERMVPLPTPTLTLLSGYLKIIKRTEGTPYLFPTQKSKKIAPITRQSVWGILKKILRCAGITKKISPHSLRHSLATHLLNNGADIRSLQMLLGHETIETVQIYTHLETKQLRKVYDKKHPRS